MSSGRKSRRTEKQYVKGDHSNKDPEKSRDNKTQRDHNTVGRVSRGGIVLQGDYNEVQIHQITQVFQTAPPNVLEEDELIRLKNAVPQNLSKLKDTIHKKHEGIVGNPYHLLEALDPTEQGYLGGRKKIIDFISGKLKKDRLVFLAGDHGMGKTSLLRAGLIPFFTSAGHWPVWVEASTESLDITIKKRILGSLNDFPTIAQRPLKDVLRLSAAFLPKNSDILLLLDNMEVFFMQVGDKQDVFYDLWRECIHDTGLPVRWVFSTADIKHHLKRFQSGETNPYANLIVLSPLDHAGAREAILAPAKASNIKIDDSVLNALLADCGKEVDPTRLQIICHTLAGGNTSINKSWKMADYEKLGRASGILQGYLDRVIIELHPQKRDPAWQVLASFEQSGSTPIRADWLEQQLVSLGYRNIELASLLEDLQRKHLILIGEDGYRLANESMKPRIREWMEQEAIPKQIQRETSRQVEQIRNSALRGLVSGSIGFSLFRWTVGNPPINILTGGIQWLEAIFLTLLYGMVGGLIGLLLMLFVDVSSIMKINIRARYFTGGLSGAVAFSLALTLFVYLNIPGDTPLQNAFSSALVGGLWGLVAGLGITWGMATKRPAWLFILIVPLLSAIILVFTDTLLNTLARSDPFQVAIGGWVFPFFISIGARIRTSIRS